MREWQESGRESGKRIHWIPAFKSMMEQADSLQYFAHVHFVHISLIFASPQGDGILPSPKETLKK
jgi:hypothetical protein